MDKLAPPFRDDFDPRFFERAARVLGALTRFWFRFKLHGAERLPDRPCLIVGNHSALGTAELSCLIAGWHEAFGTRRRATGLMHDFFIAAPGVGAFYRRVGAVNASHDNGLAALAAGHDVVVFPGGDLDACRPFHAPRQVCFGRRRGYARLALRAGVPVVPMATIGSHYTWLMAPGGEALARVPAVRRLFRTDCVPLPLGIGVAVGAVALGLAGVFPAWLAAAGVAGGLVPTPARITTRFLDPIDVTAATSDLDDPEERVERAHELVHGALSSAVATMDHEEPELAPQLPA